jgi:broad specificity phosphatase PhoE
MTSSFFATLEKPVDFYIIRHGQSEGNSAGILQGKEDFPLSEKGKLQAAERGRSLAKDLVDQDRGKMLVFASPLSRARETAEIIAAQAGLPKPIICDELEELELGIWTGKTFEKVKNEDPALWRKFNAYSWDAVPGAESSSALYERALRIWAMLRDEAKKHDADKVFAISHGGIIHWLYKCTFRCHTWFPLIPIPNAKPLKFHVEAPAFEGQVFAEWV